MRLCGREYPRDRPIYREYPRGGVVKPVHMVVGVAAVALTGGAAVWGSWCWYRLRQSAWFWRVLRAAQAVIVLEAALGGVYELTGRRASELHLIYGLVPLGVSFVAEQLRIASAQMVLDSRGLESAQAVGRLPEEEQRVIVLRIVQREYGVMALAAIVMVILLVRAAMTGG